MKRVIVACLVLRACTLALHGEWRPALVDIGLFSRTRPIYAPQPGVPDEARLKHLSGAGKFILYIWRDGSVRQVQVAQSTGHATLDKAAVDALSKWRFRPHVLAKFTVAIKLGLN